MADILNLSLRVVDLTTRPARYVLGRLLERSHRDVPTAEPRFERDEPAPPRRAPSPKARRRAARHEPTRGQAAAIRAQQREEEWGDAPGPGANVVIDRDVIDLTKP